MNPTAYSITVLAIVVLAALLWKGDVKVVVSLHPLKLTLTAGDRRRRH